MSLAFGHDYFLLKPTCRNYTIDKTNLVSQTEHFSREKFAREVAVQPPPVRPVVPTEHSQSSRARSARISVNTARWKHISVSQAVHGESKSFRNKWTRHVQ